MCGAAERDTLLAHAVEDCSDTHLGLTVTADMPGRVPYCSVRVSVAFKLRIQMRLDFTNRRIARRGGVVFRAVAGACGARLTGPYGCTELPPRRDTL